MSDTNIKTFTNYFKSQIEYWGYKAEENYENNLIDYCIKMHLCSRTYNLVWLVEGMSDVVFYRNINIKLTDNSFFVFADSKDYNKQLVGKQSVLSAYMLIKKNEQLNKHMNKYIFMVDHDYDGIDSYRPSINSKYEQFSDKDKRNISVTEGYSFENYITTTDNIEKIFEIVCSIKGLNKADEIRRFNEKYDNFKGEIVEFFSWYACIVYGCANNLFRYYPSLIKVDDIFRYDFNNKDIYNKDLLKSALQERKDFILSNVQNLRKEYIDELKRKQKEYYKIIVEENYIQGHTLYNFLVEYFKYYLKFDLRMDSRNTEFINRVLNNLKIKFTINLGNGKRIEEP